MIKQMLKLAGVKSEKEFLKKFPTQKSFEEAYPEASMLLGANKNYYQDGGQMMPEQQQEAAAQQQQIVEFIMGLLQQNTPPDQIVDQLVEAGLPEDQAQQLVSAVMEQIESQMQGPSPEEQMMGQAPPSEVPEQGAEQVDSDQPMMRMGGKPCYKCGGKYRKGGSTYSGTYSGGVYYADGGPAFTPDYGMMAMGGSYDNPGFNALPLEVQNKIKQGSKAMYGGYYANGGETDDCPPNMIKTPDGQCNCKPGFKTVFDENDVKKCIPEAGDEAAGSDEGVGELIPPGAPSANMGEGPRLTAGFGLANKGYNFDYNFGMNPRTKKDITHGARLGLPNLFGKGKGLTLTGEYAPGRSWNVGLESPKIPLLGGTLNISGSARQNLANQQSNDQDEMMMMRRPSPSSTNRSSMGYDASLEYKKRLGKDKKAPTATVRFGYTQQYGGLAKFMDGGQMQQQEAAGQQEAMMQQLMAQIGQMLQQGAQPEQIIPQLVQMGMSEEQAMQIIQMTAQQMSGGGQGAVMPMQVGMYGGSYYRGGKVQKYKKGGEYELSESEIQDLVNKGYKIQYM